MGNKMGTICSGKDGPAAPIQYSASGFAIVPCELPVKTKVAEKNITVYDMVLGGVDKFANNIAFIDTIGAEERTITFGDLRNRVRAIAKGLLARKIGQGDIIGVYGPNCIDWICVTHAAMLAGITVAPINPTYETREVMHHLTEATEGKQKVKAIFTVPVEPFKARAIEAAKLYAEQEGGDKPLDVVYLLGGDLEKLIGEGETISEAALEAAKASIDPKKTIALLPGSSGTTGPPKCVELTHYSLATNMEQSNAALGYTSEDVTIAFLPFFHAFGFCMFVGFCLRHGCKVVIMAKFDPKKYFELIGREKPTMLHVVPPVANALAKMAPEGLLDCLKSVLCAAAPLTKEQEDALQQKLKNGIVIQAYGMTELSPVGTCTPLFTAEQRQMARDRTGTVGPLVPGTALRLLKVEGEDDPTRGLLQIKGPQVMHGYRKRPEQTQKTILQGGWMDTGDVAVVDKAGYIWIVDRVKELIKVKGFQVAPAELEGLLNQVDAVRECCVIGVENERAGEVPKAFVSLTPGVQLGAEELYKKIDEYLTSIGTSDFKRLKGGVEIVADVKKTASGKLLRKDYRLLEKARAEKTEAAPTADVCFAPTQ